MQFDKKYWDNRWYNAETGWDLKGPSPAILDLIKSKCNKEDKILFPGAGNGYEAGLLYEQHDFSNIHLCDLAKQPLDNFSSSYPTFPKQQLHNLNFFDLEGTYDFIVEQTFFCAINPERRKAYLEKTYNLLKPGAYLMGLLFNRTFDRVGPPFGGTKADYIK